MTIEPELNSLQRGLQALELLTTRGATTVAAISREMGLPRANVYRIVHTLEATGYCRRIPESSQFIATDRMAHIAAQACLEDRIVNAALPVFDAMTQRVEWPLVLVVPDGVNMRVRLSTDRDNTRAIARFAAGKTTPLLKATTGILALALRPEAETELLLATLIECGQVNAFFFGDEKMVRRVIAKAQVGRYAMNDSRYVEGSLGVPIMLGDRAVAGIAMKYVRAGVTRPEILSRYLPLLQDYAQQIAGGIAGGRPTDPDIDQVAISG